MSTYYYSSGTITKYGDHLNKYEDGATFPPQRYVISCVKTSLMFYKLF